MGLWGVCEGCKGCTARKSGPGWRLVRETRVSVRVPADRSPRYTNFSQLDMGPKSPKFSRRFAPKYPIEWFKPGIKHAFFPALRAVVPLWPSSMGFPD